MLNTNFNPFNSFGSFKGVHFSPDSLQAKFFSTSLPSSSIFDSDKIMNSLSNLDINSKEDFIYMTNLKLDRNISLEGKKFKSYSNLGPLDSPLFKNSLINFLNSLQESQLYAVFFRVPSTDGGFISTHKQIVLNSTINPNIIISRLINSINYWESFYEVSTSSTIIVEYFPFYANINLPDNSTNNLYKDLLKALKKDNPEFDSKLLKNNNIPYSMDRSKYGILVNSIVISEVLSIKTYLYKNIKFIIEDIDSTTAFVKVYDKSDIKILEFTDENFGDYFIRNIYDLCLKIDHHEKIIYAEKSYKTKFVETTQRELIVKNKIITFDIEAFLHPIPKDDYNFLGINNNKIDKCLEMFVPFACGFYDGQISYKFYLSDYQDYKSMLKACILEMANPKYKDFTIYVHNGGGFDFIFLLDVIKDFNDQILIGKPKFTGKDSKVIGFDIKIHNPLYQTKSIKPTVVTLRFRDSYKLLSHSLRNLTTEFKVDNIKGTFPYIFPNAYNLNYKGNKPDIKFYNISIKDYNSINNDNWDLKEECFKYLDNDLIGLHQVLLIFSDFIYNKYRLNITKVFSISSLAMKIFTSNYLKNNNIPIISNRKVHKDIREALYGGRVEVFNPIVLKDSFMYDVNSIYPWAMLMPMPVGSPTYSNNTNLKDLFGMVNATVFIPEHADPVLPKRTPEGLLIFPKGKWTAWFFSEELKNAQSFGVQVTVHRSYLFEKSTDLFKEFIEDLFEMKRTSSDSKRAIYKLIMNSSYGRWALKFFKTVIDVVDKDKADQLLLTHNVEEYIPYENDNKVYIRHSVLPDQENCLDYNIDYGMELIKSVNSQHDSVSSIPIGVAITSWARILMSSFLFNPANPCAYSDTDCGVFFKKLPSNLVNDHLGGWKLEHIVNKGLFPLDKVYTLTTSKKTITKNKGISGKLTPLNYIDLYKGKSLDLIEKRWVKNLSAGLIYIDNINIHINSNYSKRSKVFYKGFWIGTQPLTVLNDLIINKPVLANFNYNNYLYYFKYNNLIIYKEINNKPTDLLYLPLNPLTKIKKDFSLIKFSPSLRDSSLVGPDNKLIKK